MRGTDIKSFWHLQADFSSQVYAKVRSVFYFWPILKASHFSPIKNANVPYCGKKKTINSHQGWSK